MLSSLSGRDEMRAVVNWLKRNNWWLAWVAGPLLGVAASAILLAVKLDYQLTDAVPQLKQAVKDESALIRQDLGKLEERQRQELAAHTTEERGHRDRFKTDIAALRSHVLELKVRVHGKVQPGEIRDLVSKVHDVSATEASLFASISDVEGVPTIQASFTKVDKAASPTWAHSVNMLKGGYIPVERALNVMLLAKGGQWDVEGSGLKVRYDGGSATFAAKPGTSKMELLRAADVFNAISQAAQTVGSDRFSPEAPAPKKPASIDKPRGALSGGDAVARPPTVEPRSPPVLQNIK
jgi:hypothetical protein